jgi:hypothetical protein
LLALCGSNGPDRMIGKFHRRIRAKNWWVAAIDNSRATRVFNRVFIQ